MIKCRFTNLISIFAVHLPYVAVKSPVEDGADGWSTTLRKKRHCTLCF